MAHLLRICPDVRACSWTEHGRKHFPHSGLTKEHTRHGPAKYLPGTTSPKIRELETRTVASSTAGAESHNEYLRELEKTIGWDLGKDATLSFVECSGGNESGRMFHGRPMCSDNPKAKP